MTIKEIEIQLALGTLSDSDRLKLSYSRNTPKKILIILSKDKSWYIRYRVAYNLNTPIKVLTKLLKDNDNTVSSRADIHLNNIGNMYINEE